MSMGLITDEDGEYGQDGGESKSPSGMLIQAIHDEINAHQTYMEYAARARKLGYIELAQLFEHIAVEEMGHREGLANMLAKHQAQVYPR